MNGFPSKDNNENSSQDLIWEEHPRLVCHHCCQPQGHRRRLRRERASSTSISSAYSCVGSNLMGKRKNPEIPNCNWTPRTELIFLTQLHDYSVGKNGRKPGITDFEAWAIELSKEFGHPVTLDQLRSKRDRFRKLFDKFKKFRDNTGLGWNSVTGTVTCSDEFWDQYVQCNKDAKNFRAEGLPYYEMYEEIFEKNHASGVIMFGSGSASNPFTSVNLENPQVNLSDDSSNSDGEGFGTRMTQDHGRKEDHITSRGIVKKGQKRGKNSLDAQACDALKTIAETISAKYSSSTTAASTNNKSGILQCQKNFKEMKLDSHTYNRALKFFMDDSRRCEVFIEMEEDRRPDFLRDFLPPVDVDSTSQCI